MHRRNSSRLGLLAGIRRGVIASCLALVMAMVPFAVSAEADPPDNSGVVARGDGALGFVHVGDGYLAMTFDIEFFCTNPGPPPTGPGGMTVLPANGASIQFTRSVVPVAVYEYTGTADRSAVFGFLFENCGPLLDGDPSTIPAEPVAAGDARLRTSLRSRPNDPIVYTHSSIIGMVTTTAGDTVALSSDARIEIDIATGEATVVRMVVNYGG